MSGEIPDQDGSRDPSDSARGVLPVAAQLVVAMDPRRRAGAPTPVPMRSWALRSTPVASVGNMTPTHCECGRPLEAPSGHSGSTTITEPCDCGIEWEFAYDPNGAPVNVSRK